ncbi:MAG: hypothetical protein AB1469_08045 [Pseudomonadota bacterium]
MEFSETKNEKAIFVFLHFSITCAIEKWRHLRRYAILLRWQAQGKPSLAYPLAASLRAHVPQESLNKSEIPVE